MTLSLLLLRSNIDSLNDLKIIKFRKIINLGISENFAKTFRTESAEQSTNKSHHNNSILLGITMIV